MHQATSSTHAARLPRVGFLVGSPKIGGAERQVWHLAHGLRAVGVDARVLFMERKGRRPASTCIDYSSLPHAYLGSGRGRRWFARWRLRGQLRELDAVVAFNLDAMELIAEQDSVVRVGSVRGLGFTRDAVLADRMRRVCGELDLVTCNSPAIARALAEIGVATEVGVLPNVVSAAAAAGPGNEDCLRVLFVGNLIAVKRPDFFIGACIDAISTCPALRISIAGDGPLRGEAEKLAVAHAGHFEFLGHLPPEAVPYGNADVVVSTSIREGSSNALLEGMAAGCAVVATRAGGNVDLVEESGGGLLVPVEGQEEFTAALVRLAGDRDLRLRLGAAGRAYVLENHARDAVARTLIEMLAAASGRRVDG